MKVAAPILVACVVALGSCGISSTFQCEQDGDCALDSLAGYCEADGYCSFDDDSCPSSRRYGQHAPKELAGECVSVEPEPGSSGMQTSSTSEPTPSTSGASTDTGAMPGTSTGEAETTTASTTGADPSDWWDSAWAVRQRVTVAAMDLGGDIERLPVPVMLDPELREDSSLVFVTDAGADVPWEREEAVVWVGVDVMDQTAVEVWAYGGNPNPPKSAPSSVWDDGYLAVWHLSDEPDASGNGHHLDTVGATPDDGPFDGAAAFDGTGFLEAQPHPALADLRDEGFTVEAMIEVEPGAPNGWHRLVDKANALDPTSGWSLIVHGDGTEFQLSLSLGTAEGELQYDSGSVTPKGWTHVAVAVPPGEDPQFWVDGVLLKTSLTFDASGQPTSDEGISVRIGAPHEQADITRWFDGRVDEVRLSSGPRSSAWVRAAAAVSLQDVVSVGPREAL